MRKNVLTSARQRQSEDTRELLDNLGEFARTLRDHLGLDIVFISRFGRDYQTLEVVEACESITPPPFETSDRIAIEKSYCKRVADGKLPALIHDVESDTRVHDLEEVNRLKIRTNLSVPICLSDGRVFGSICGFSYKVVPELNQRDVQLVKLFADFVARHIENLEQHSADMDHQEADIQQIIDDGLFQTMMQPITRLEDKTIVGFEVLTRFNQEPRMAPNEWFEQASCVGLLETLEITVIKNALSKLQIPEKEYFFSFNFSADTIVAPQFKDWIDSVSGHQIIIELTEHDAVHNYVELREAVEAFRQGGVRLAIDDLGSGYASFAKLIELTPDIFKIDASIVGGIDEDDHKKALVSALVEYARITEIQLVAEGIENHRELDVLKRIGVELGQGFHLGKPMPPIDYFNLAPATN